MADPVDVLEIMARALQTFDSPKQTWESLDAGNGSYHQDRYRAKAKAALAALEAAGYVVMPVEPTEEMIWQAATALDHPSVYMGGPSWGNKRNAATVYRAMLDARPG